MRHGSENTSSFDLKSQNAHFATIQAQIGHWRVHCVLNLISRAFQIKMVDIKIQTSNTGLFFKTIDFK